MTSYTSSSLEQVRYLLKQFYPRGSAWRAKISEAEFDFKLPSKWAHRENGCREMVGIAIDLDGDKRADRFLYNDIPTVSLTASNLDHYLRPLRARARNKKATCQNPAVQFQPAGFPFDGQLLPDSMGMITGLMFVANRSTEDAFIQLMQRRPDISFQVLYPDDVKDYPALLTEEEQEFHNQFGYFLPQRFAQYGLQRGFGFLAPRLQFFPFDYEKRGNECDFTFQCGIGVWVQDDIYVGANEAGALIVGGSPYHLKNLGQPIANAFGAVLFRPDQVEENGDMLNTSRYLFVPKVADTFALYPKSNSIAVFAYGKEIIEIDRNPIKSAAHLDMLLTPTEDRNDGKPVVFLAEPTCLDGNLHCVGEVREAYDHLEKVKRELEDQGFHVERLPYVYTGEKRWGGGPFGGSYNDAYSYHNVLMEHYNDDGLLVKRVYMPWYGSASSPLSEFSQRAKEIYERYGYEVIPITGLEEKARLGGGLRCLSKVTNRSHF